MKRLLLCWGALLLLLGAEVAGALLHRPWLAWGAAPIMIAVVVLAFMHVLEESPLARIFAVTGLVWIGIMLLLGTTDYAARHTIPAPQRVIPP